MELKTQSKVRIAASPVRVQGAGWDVLIILRNGESAKQKHLCNARGPYTLAQAQMAADAVRRDAKGREVAYFNEQ